MNFEFWQGKLLNLKLPTPAHSGSIYVVCTHARRRYGCFHVRVEPAVQGAMVQYAIAAEYLRII